MKNGVSYSWWVKSLPTLGSSLRCRQKNPLWGYVIGYRHLGVNHLFWRWDKVLWKAKRRVSFAAHKFIAAKAGIVMWKNQRWKRWHMTPVIFLDWQIKKVLKSWKYNIKKKRRKRDKMRQRQKSSKAHFLKKYVDCRFLIFLTPYPSLVSYTFIHSHLPLTMSWNTWTLV